MRIDIIPSMAIRKEIRDVIGAVDALLVGIATQEFSDEEFEAIKELPSRIERSILVYHVQEECTPPSEMTH